MIMRKVIYKIRAIVSDIRNWLSDRRERKAKTNYIFRVILLYNNGLLNAQQFNTEISYIRDHRVKPSK